LTKLSNRRFYEEELEKIDTADNLPLTLVMVDVNGLKLTNDAFGHNSGDELLLKTANVLSKVCKNYGTIARIGGDEFVLILPDCSHDKAVRIITSINQAIAAEKTERIILSISMGFAVKNSVSEDISDVFRKAEDNMYKNKLYESSNMRNRTIDIIMKTLYEKNNREMLHSQRVSELCESIAVQMNFDEDDLHQMRLAGLMHDIGKIGIDESILKKPGKLNSTEWNEIYRHSEIGYRILSSVNEFSEIAEYVLAHHEKWDGSGYPKGLRGTEIPLKSRIIAIADSYDAMTTECIYNRSLSPSEAVKEIIRCSSTQFDANIAQIFVEKVLGATWE
jgi:diguanylate cyclase (GGDEF)-like protein/putative nucleotidyltransferase with HDIG domain